MGLSPVTGREPRRWGAKAPKPKRGVRDPWAKPKRKQRKKQWGVDPKAKKKDKQWAADPKKDTWGREPKGEKSKGIFGATSERKSRKSWFGRFFKGRRGLSVRDYYNKIDRITAMEQQSETATETVAQRIQRYIEGITRKNLGPGQIDQIRQILSPQKVVAFVTNLLRR